jgi:hypothetical protein
MKFFLWTCLALILIGDAFFVLPGQFSQHSISTNYFINYKKDSALLKNVFPDSPVYLRLNMAQLYEAIYRASDSSATHPGNPSRLFVNVSISHNLDFTALLFPFYKVTTFHSVIPFYSIIKASNFPDMDSTALIGNITINGKLTVKGICTPLYARNLVEKELVSILKKEMNKVELDINRPPAQDSVAAETTAPVPAPRQPGKRRR